MPLSAADKGVLTAQMAGVPANADNGTSFYSTLFTKAPDAKKFFATDIDPAKVPGNERFQKLGAGFIALVNKWVAACDSAEFDKLIAAHTTDHTAKHKVPIEWYEGIWGVWQGWLESKVGMSADQKKAWQAFSTHWVDVARPLAFK